jgi:O-antigen ligase
MNPEEVKQRLINIGILAFCTTVMILTFSRGGLYFIGATAMLFLYYNRAKMGQYFKFIFLVPVAFFIYSYVVNQTGGKIVERYEQEGTSNRDQLVKIGFKIFLDNPVFGVGTSNYNTTIVKEKLFNQESGAHNEFIRAAAEHGIFGVVFYWGFYILLFLNIIRRKQPQKQYAMYFFVLFCLIMIHNGLKISLQPILIMLAIATPTLLYKGQQNVVIENHPAARFA